MLVQFMAYNFSCKILICIQRLLADVAVSEILAAAYDWSQTSSSTSKLLARATIILHIQYNTECFMDTPMQVNGSCDPFPILFLKFINLWYRRPLDLYVIVSTLILGALWPWNNFCQHLRILDGSLLSWHCQMPSALANEITETHVARKCHVKCALTHVAIMQPPAPGWPQLAVEL